jgi:lysophospholipase L1-like esterase
MSPWPLKPFLAIATFCAIIAAPQFIPQLYNWRIFEWSTVPTVLDFKPRLASAPVEQEVADLKPDMMPVKNPSSRIQDPNNTLDPFFAALYNAERRQSGARVRILHYGDSPTTADLITADVRTLLQDRFGDAGHGLHLIAKPWAWYSHRGFEVESDGWTIHPATLRQQKDGRYGVGGVSFTAGSGAYSRITARRKGHQRLRLSYFGQPGAGHIALTADGMDVGTLDTSLPQPAAAWHDFPVPSEARKFEIRVTSGAVRLFCVSLEKNQPGVVYDSIGLNGSWAGVLATYVNEQHWGEQMRAVNPDLVIINYGTNESGFPQYIDSTYAKDMAKVVSRVRHALPSTPVLVMTPMDRGQRQAGGVIGTIPGLPRVVATQAKLAGDNGVAFFNTFEAMGGPGTMGRWYAAEPRLVSADFIHPMPNGARIVGGLLYQGLLDGYTRYKLRLLQKMTAQLRGTAKP